MNKKVLIVSQYFYPENFRINDLAKVLVKKGYQVEALVGIPNYPDGVYYKGYGFFKRRKENINGLNVYRVFQTPRGNKGSLLMLSINYLTYALFASLWILFKFIFKNKYDAIIAMQLSPITSVYPAILLRALRGSKLITWVMDIWPDSITDNTSEKVNRLLLPILTTITELVYKKSDKILISSKGMKELVCRHHDYSSKIEYQPNWSSDFLDVHHKDSVILPGQFKLVMAGTIGDGLGIDDLIDFVSYLKDENDISILFVGGGTKEVYLRNELSKRKLSNAFVLGRLPYEKMPSIYAQADAMFLTLLKTPYKHLDVTVPGRLQSYMSAGKPIFAMIGIGAREVIERNNCGFAVPAGDAKGLADLVIAHYKDKTLLEEKGHNARKAFEKEFTIEKGIEHFEKLINQ